MNNTIIEMWAVTKVYDRKEVLHQLDLKIERGTIYGLLATNSFLNVLYYIGLGFGCGMAPAYAAFIVERKYHRTTPRMFLKEILKTVSMKKCTAVPVLFGLIQLAAYGPTKAVSPKPMLWVKLLLCRPEVYRSPETSGGRLKCE